MEKLSIPTDSYTSHAFGLKDSKLLQEGDMQTTEKEKKRRQGVCLVHTQWEEALRHDLWVRNILIITP